MTAPKAIFLALTAAGAVSLTTLTSCVVPVPVTPAPPPPPAPGRPPAVYAPGYIAPRLPAGYVTRTYRGVPYYAHRGVYYRRHHRGYAVVRRPRWW